MPVRLAPFEKPKRLKKDDAPATETYAKFIAEPFEPGYGHTIGNSLRRVLLSSLEGAAATSIKIDGAMHEFATVEGVQEDVTEIVLNVKKILFKCHTRDPQSLILSVNKDGLVTAGDIELNQNIEIINPKQPICTLDKKKKLTIEFEVKIGRGFCPGDENKKSEQAIGVVPVDSLFSPVTRVRYAVESARVGQRTDYDRLVLEVWTDGRITPDDALLQSSAILQHHLDVFVGYDKNAIEFEQVEVKQDDEKAAEFYRKAAERNHPKAQFNLGMMYDNGEGVTQDHVKAHALSNMAAASGDKFAAKNRDNIAAMMASFSCCSECHQFVLHTR